MRRGTDGELWRPRFFDRGGLAQTLFSNVCDLPKVRFAEGCEEMPRPPLWSLREIADSKLRSLRQPPGEGRLDQPPERLGDGQATMFTPCICGLEATFLDGIAIDLIQIRELSRSRADENWRFRQFLKGQCDLKPDQIDKQVIETTRRVWAGIDCTACANCCREVKPSFSAGTHTDVSHCVRGGGELERIHGILEMAAAAKRTGAANARKAIGQGSLPRWVGVGQRFAGRRPSCRGG